MKWMIASDIHGSMLYTEKMLEAFDREGAHRLLLLGDILYHGPRNELTMKYNSMGVANLLNERKHKIVAVRGNCDSEVDQMVLEFPIMADYNIITVSGTQNEVSIYATHGHMYNPQNPLPMAEGSILLNGHTHVPACIEYGEFTYMNPGSISIPKEQSTHSYMIIENGVCEWKNIHGIVYKTHKL